MASSLAVAVAELQAASAALSAGAEYVETGAGGNAATVLPRAQRYVVDALSNVAAHLSNVAGHVDEALLGAEQQCARAAVEAEALAVRARHMAEYTRRGAERQARRPARRGHWQQGVALPADPSDATRTRRGTIFQGPGAEPPLRPVSLDTNELCTVGVTVSQAYTPPAVGALHQGDTTGAPTIFPQGLPAARAGDAGLAANRESRSPSSMAMEDVKRPKDRRKESVVFDDNPLLEAFGAASADDSGSWTSPKSSAPPPATSQQIAPQQGLRAVQLPKKPPPPPPPVRR